MLKYERKFMDWLVRHRDILFFGLVTVLALLARRRGLDFASGDMQSFLLPWAQTFYEGGFSAMKEQVGDYNILYQTLTILLTRIPESLVYFVTRLQGNMMYRYKYLSIFFDFSMALLCAGIVAKERGERKLGTLWNLTYMVILFLPTVFLNSAVWGQCDAMCGFFCILALYSLYKERYIFSFAVLGLSFALKLQTVFILPVYLYFYISRKNFTLLYFLLTAAVLWATGIPAYLQGRPLTTVLDIYMFQTGEYPTMALNSASFWLMFFPNWYSMRTCAIVVTMLVLGIFLYLFIGKGERLKGDFESFLILSIWSAWTCVLFLPGMHERYTYLVDVLLVVLTLYRTKYWWYAMTFVVISGLTYTSYLTGVDLKTELVIMSAINTGMWLHYTLWTLPQCLTPAESVKR